MNGKAPMATNGQLINKRVEFQTDTASFGEGTVIEHDDATGALQVRDDDGTVWHGDEDKIIVLENPN